MSRPGRSGMLSGMDFSRTATSVIDAPPARVFEVITDIDRLPEWNAEIANVVEGCAVLEVGAEWVVEIHALHTHWKSRSRVIELDPGRGRFAYRSQTDDGNPSHADWQWDVTADPAGTRVRVTVEARPRTFWRKLLASRLRPPGLQEAMDRSLRALSEQVAG
jgi:uncharacterized protein YndB with AHSA1/START domain